MGLFDDYSGGFDTSIYKRKSNPFEYKPSESTFPSFDVGGSLGGRKYDDFCRISGEVPFRILEVVRNFSLDSVTLVM